MIEILNNWVLVLPDNDYSKFKSGMDIADIFEPGKHISVWGKVLQLPKELVCYQSLIKRLMAYKESEDLRGFMQKLNSLSLEFDTENELQVGDRVAFKYVAKMNAQTDDLYVQTERGQAIFVPYDLIYLAKRGERIVPINGWLLVEPFTMDEAQVREECRGMVFNARNYEKDGIGIVRHAAKPLKGYLIGDYIDDDKIQVGDTVVFRNGFRVPIEWHEHSEMGRYWRMQRKDINLLKKS
jgi:hypothetical protein